MIPANIFEIQVCSKLFSDMRESSSSRKAQYIGVLTGILLLIPAGRQLMPLGRQSYFARTNLNQALSQYDSSIAQLQQINVTVHTEQQQLIDLDCVADVSLTQNKDTNNCLMNDTFSYMMPADCLYALGQMQFIPDNIMVMPPSSMQKTKTTYGYRYAYGWGYSASHCGKDSNGNTKYCYYYGLHWGSINYDYIETTTITNSYKNILQGLDFDMMNWTCGFYSQSSKFFAPQMYIVAQTSMKTTGTPESGSVGITYTNNYGSRIPVEYTIDGSKIAATVTVPQSMTQSQAANNVTQDLRQFLNQEHTAFQASDVRYNETQRFFKENIPQLLADFKRINATLPEQLLALNEAKTVHTQAFKKFTETLFIDLGAIAMSSIGFAVIFFHLFEYCKKSQNRHVTPTIGLTNLPSQTNTAHREQIHHEKTPLLREQRSIFSGPPSAKETINVPTGGYYQYAPQGESSCV